MHILKGYIGSMQSEIDSIGLTIYDRALKVIFIDGSSCYLTFSTSAFKNMNISNYEFVHFSKDLNKYKLNPKTFKNVPVDCIISNFDYYVENCAIFTMK